jgi:hypothetical protein
MSDKSADELKAETCPHGVSTQEGCKDCFAEGKLSHVTTVEFELAKAESAAKLQKLEALLLNAIQGVEQAQRDGEEHQRTVMMEDRVLAVALKMVEAGEVGDTDYFAQRAWHMVNSCQKVVANPPVEKDPIAAKGLGSFEQAGTQASKQQ